MRKPFLNSARKYATHLSERVLSPEQTLQRASKLAKDKGVTRVSDITGLDRIGIPVFSAVVPKSDDTISVYNGKGVTPTDAHVGALMESIERQTALTSNVAVIASSYSRLRQQGTAVVNPASFNHRLKSSYSEEQEYGWVEGYDLVHEEPILVPAILAGFGRRFSGAGSPFQTYSSDGLASGNCIEEAVCHAVCELIERDAWTLAELRSCWIPRARWEALIGAAAEAYCVDDYDAYPRIGLNQAGWPIAELLEKFGRAGLYPVVRDITSEFGVSCVIASAAEEFVAGFPQAHSGLGAHPNATIAVVRALTELAQSRVVDIQGVREDILPADATPKVHERNTQRMKRVEYARWVLCPQGRQRELHDMQSSERDDIADDIRQIIDALARGGIERVVVVNLSEPGGYAVVRVVIPGLEFWMLDGGKLGSRAVQFWKRFAAAA